MGLENSVTKQFKLFDLAFEHMQNGIKSFVII